MAGLGKWLEPALAGEEIQIRKGDAVSLDVLAEARRGDEEAARRRLEVLSECKMLAVTPAARQLTKRVLETGLIPPRGAAEAAHIGLAAAHGMDFLLT